jgi:hypothetical protein
MEIQIRTTAPEECAKKAGKTYETQFIYIGFSRYDTVKKTLSKFTSETDSIRYSETPCTMNVFSRGYHVENARVTIYSEAPRIWSEELGPGEIHFFVQQPTQVAAT